MLIRDVLKLKGSAIHSVSPDTALVDCVAAMVARDIGSLVVLDQGRMVGLLTFREVLGALEQAGGQLGARVAGDVMVPDPMLGQPSDTIDEVCEAMTARHVRYLPVTEAGALVGVISFHDVAKASLSATRYENRLLRRVLGAEADAPRQSGESGDER